MTPQDFKALLDALHAIEKAIEGKGDNVTVKVVNRFAPVLRGLKRLYKKSLGCDCAGEALMRREIEKIIKTYGKIATEILNEKTT